MNACRRVAWLHAGLRAILVALGVASASAADTIPVTTNVRRQATQEPETPLADASENDQMAEARRFFAAGDYDGALEALQHAAEQDPKLPPARAMLAMMFFATGQNEPGRRMLEQAAANTPDHPEIYQLFARLALGQGRVTEAELAFEKALAVEPPDAWTEEQIKRLEFICADGLAVVAEARGDWEAARRQLEQALALEPENGSLLQRLGQARFKLGEPRAAFETLRKAVELDPELEPPGVTIGRFYLSEGNLEKAEEWIDYAIRAAPEDPRPRQARAVWLLDQGKTEEAAEEIAALEEMLEPDSADLRRLKGLAAYHRGDFVTAAEHLQTATIESPNDFAISNLLALALAELDDPDKRRRALELAQVNARQFPNSTEALATLGWAQFRNGRIQEAERSLGAVVNAGSMNSDTAFRIAQVLEARGRTEEAERLVRRALDTPGPFAARAKARDWLKHVGGDSNPTP